MGRTKGWLALVFSAVTAVALAQPAKSPGAAPRKTGLPEVTVTGGFRTKVHDRERNRPMAEVSGREARPSLSGPGQLVITGFKLEMLRYAPDPAIELIVESPAAVFGGQQGASSEREITVRHAEGRFVVAGQGWLWDQATGLLVISNAVRTDLRRAQAPTNREPVHITASRLEYNLKSGDTRFIGECVATEPGSARIRAGELTAKLSAEAERPNAIGARGGVVIELLKTGREGRATGESAEYRDGLQGEEIVLRGSPTWELGPGRGSAEMLLLFPARDAYTATGDARVELRLAGKPGGELPVRERPPVFITAARIDAVPGKVEFEGPVSLTQSNRVDLRADHVSVALSGKDATTAAGEAVERAVATGNVVARVATGTGPVELRGGEMLYGTGEHPFIEVGRDPSWSSARHSGSGRRFFLHPDQARFQVVDDVRLEWRTGGTATNLGPVRLEAGGLVLQEQEARFSGGVRVRRDLWALKGREIDLQLTTNSLLKGLVARGDVEFEYTVPREARGTNAPRTGLLTAFMDDLSETVRRWTISAAQLEATLNPGGTDVTRLSADGGVKVQHVGLDASGERMQYSDADGALRLTGDARLTTVEGLVIVGAPDCALALDPRRGVFRVEGMTRRLTLPAKALRATNTVSASSGPAEPVRR